MTSCLPRLRLKRSPRDDEQKPPPLAVNRVEQTSIAANLPVELLLYIFSFAHDRVSGLLPEDYGGFSELYEVTWGKIDYDKQLLAVVALVCSSWNHTATYLLYNTIFISSTASIEPLLRTLNSETWKQKGLQVSDIVFHPQNDGPTFSMEGSTATKNMISSIKSFPPTIRMHLHTKAYYFPQSHQSFTDMNNMTSLHLENPGTLPSLILRDRGPLVTMWHDLTHVSRLRNLHTLSLHGILVREKEFTTDTFPSLVRLKLTECWFPPDFMLENYGWTGDAERIDLRLSYLYMSGICDGWRFLQNVLRASAETLESLALAELEFTYPRQLDVEPEFHVLAYDSYVPPRVRQQLPYLPRLRKLFLTDTFFLSSFPILRIPLSVEELSVFSHRRYPRGGTQTWRIYEIITDVLDLGEGDFKLMNINVADKYTGWGDVVLKGLLKRCAELGINFKADLRDVCDDFRWNFGKRLMTHAILPLLVMPTESAYPKNKVCVTKIICVKTLHASLSSSNAVLTREAIAETNVPKSCISNSPTYRGVCVSPTLQLESPTRRHAIHYRRKISYTTRSRDNNCIVCLREPHILSRG